jgi:hypothetical protein
LMTVVLPAPLGPRRPKTSPGRMEMVNSSTAISDPKRFVSESVSRITNSVPPMEVSQGRNVNRNGGSSKLRMIMRIGDRHAAMM